MTRLRINSFALFIYTLALVFTKSATAFHLLEVFFFFAFSIHKNISFVFDKAKGVLEVILLLFLHLICRDYSIELKAAYDSCIFRFMPLQHLRKNSNFFKISPNFIFLVIASSHFSLFILNFYEFMIIFR